MEVVTPLDIQVGRGGVSRWQWGVFFFPILGSRVCEGVPEGVQTVGEGPPGQILEKLGPIGFSNFWPTAMPRGGGSRDGSWVDFFPILGSRVCRGPTEGGQTVGEKPPGQILGNLGTDRIFEFLTNCLLETPLSTWMSRPPSRHGSWVEKKFSHIQGIPGPIG